MERGIIDNFSNNGPTSSAVQLYRPINAGTLTAIAGEVIDRIRRFVRSVAVRIRSIWSYNPDYNSDFDSDFLLDDEEVITHISEDDSVLDDEEEITHISEYDSVLNDEEVITYISDDDDSVLDDGEVTYLSDDEEVTYLSYASGEAYPRIVTVIYGENSGAAATRGVDQKRQAAIKSLERKIIEYDKTDCGGEIGGCCVICLEELTAGTEVAVMPCKHCSFHDGCLSTWLERSLCCPLCRHKISGPPLPEPSLEL